MKDNRVLVTPFFRRFCIPRLMHRSSLKLRTKNGEQWRIKWLIIGRNVRQSTRRFTVMLECHRYLYKSCLGSCVIYKSFTKRFRTISKRSTGSRIQKYSRGKRKLRTCFTSDIKRRKDPIDVAWRKV